MILIITLLCAAAAAVLRGFQLARSFNPADQLIANGDPLTIALMVFCVLFLAGMALHLFVSAKKKQPSRLNGSPALGTVWKAVESLAAAAFLGASGIDLIMGIRETRVSIICLGALGVLASAAVLLTALSANRLKPNTATGFWFTIPVYWCCLLLFVDFTGFAGNPVRNAFMYGMLASVFCTLALNAAAGMFFGKPKRGRLLFYAVSAAFFACLTLGGSLFARVFYNPGIDAAVLSVSEMLKLAFITLHAGALAFAVQKGWLMPPETLKTEDTIPPQEEHFYEGGESV